MATPSIVDDEFGKIPVRRSAASRQVRIRVAPDGTLRATMPRYTPLLFLRRLVKNSRDELREMLAQALPNVQYRDGQTIGKRHTLLVRDGTRTHIARESTKIIATLASGDTLNSPAVVKRLREVVITALRLEAREYLPRRLETLAVQMDCHYERVRFSHASSRWGSCSSAGTISLNIALMKLPHELIDYVIVHELAHTKEMNHSDAFWSIVSQYDVHYARHRKLLGQETPSI